MDVSADENAPQQPQMLTEGKGTVLFENEVFYNPVQEFNRDISILVLQQFVHRWWHQQRLRETKRRRNYAKRHYGFVDEYPHPAALLGYYNYRTSPQDVERDPVFDCFDVRQAPFDAEHMDWNAVHPACVVPVIDQVATDAKLSSKFGYYTPLLSSSSSSANNNNNNNNNNNRGGIPCNNGDPAGLDDVFQLTNFKEEGPEILEALSATGLRSIRYAKEITGIGSILVNDLDAAAVQAIQRNLTYNGLGEPTKQLPRVTANHNDANAEMFARVNLKFPKMKRFDVIDLDPYGSSSMFVDAAVCAVEDGGMLLVTCTDKAVMCGSRFEHAQAAYGCTNVKAPYYNEYALRMVLAMLDQRAAVRRRYVKPLLSLSVDFYVRLIVTVHDSKVDAKNHGIRKSLVYQCPNCSFFAMQPSLTHSSRPNKRNPSKGPPTVSYKPPSASVPTVCPQCDTALKIGGPIWNAPIHDVDFAQACLDDLRSRPDLFGTEKRMRGMLSTVISELQDVPLFVSLSHLAHNFTADTHKRKVYVSALLNAGYRVSATHCDADGLKTDAPLSFLFDLFRHLIATTTDGSTNTKYATALALRGKTISQEYKFDVTTHADASKRTHEVMFFPNPTANWGPKMRASSSSSSSSGGSKRPRVAGKDGSAEQQKSRDNQGRRKRMKTGLDLPPSSSSSKA